MDTRIAAIHALSRSVDITSCAACGIVIRIILSRIAIHWSRYVIRIAIRIAIFRSRYNTRIAGPSIAMHRCIVTTLVVSIKNGHGCNVLM